MPKEILYILTWVIGYLLGSVSGGIITSRLANGPALHTVGSKRTAVSNVQRTLGGKHGIITFLIDGLKGILSCLLAWLITGSHFCAMLAGLFCVIGHNWPVFFHFRGGKGVATTGGVMLYCFPVPALICIAVTVAVIALFRYISVGSMLLVTVFFILSFFFSSGNPCIIVWAFLLMAMCIARHHANISRLIHGNENKLGKKI